MISSQQQALKVYGSIGLQRQKPMKISLKLKRPDNLETKTKRTQSFHTNNEQQCKDSLSKFSNQKSQISSINGMFRYFKSNMPCCELLNFQRQDLLQDRRIRQKNEIMNQTASTLKSSFTTDAKRMGKSQILLLSKAASNCSNKNYAVQTQNKYDFGIEDTNIFNNNLFTPRKKVNSLYLNCTQRIQNYQTPKYNKFPLKKLQSNLKNNVEIQKENLGGNLKKVGFFLSESDQAGCDCLPQCFWIDKWLKLIKTNIVALNSKVDPKVLSQIEKDIQRTRPNQVFFRQAKAQNNLKEVLIMYSLVSPHLGYVQGMNFIASAIVYHSKTVTQSSAIFNLILKQKRYQTIYEGDLSLSMILAKNLSSQLSRYQPQIHSHILKNGIELQIYARNWYFTMLGNIVPLKSMHLVIDKFLKKGFRGINELLLSLLIYLKQDILSFDLEQIAIVFTIDWLSKRSQKIDWLQIVGFSQNIPSNAFQS